MSSRGPAPYHACSRCGGMVLTGTTSTGQPVTVEPSVQTYVVVWPEGHGQPLMHQSRGYPVHACGEA